MRFVFLFNLTLLLNSACLPQGFWPERGGGRGVQGEGYDVVPSAILDAADFFQDGGAFADSVWLDADAAGFDAGSNFDAGGNVVSDDAGFTDAGVTDAGVTDAGFTDGLDAGSSPDASLPPGDFGLVFMEINYLSASAATNPGRQYSDTEGWREPQWAPEPDSYRDFPEVWDIFDGIEIRNNPWGQGADIDGNDRLQWMFGLEELSQTGTVTLEIWGSGDFGSSTTLSVTNPLFGCGETVEVPFNPADELLNFTIDMTDCVQPGEGVQAIRVENGIRAFSLQRMRLTLSDAR